MWRTVYAWAMGLTYTLFWSTIGVLTWPLSPRGGLYWRYSRIWSRWILASLRIPFSVDGRGRLDRDVTYLFMANHQSLFDIFALLLAVDRPLRMVAKRALFKIPIFGWGLWMCGFIPIDRSNRQRAIRSLRLAADRIRGGVNVLVFPEGTRGDGDELLPFKKGGFMMALEAGVPIVPIAVRGTDTIMPNDSLRVGHGSIHVVMGEPIATAGRGARGRDALMREVRTALEALV